MLKIGNKEVFFTTTFLLIGTDTALLKPEQLGSEVYVGTFKSDNDESEPIQVLEDLGGRLDIGVKILKPGETTVCTFSHALDRSDGNVGLRIAAQSMNDGVLVHLELYRTHKQRS